MATILPESLSFFVSGGTMSPDAGSYVERSADGALLSNLLSGKFCYVLNSRQMGKSSLCVRTMARLRASGVATAFVDLTKIGGRNVTVKQWYAGIGMEIGRELELRKELLAYWSDNEEVSPMQRLFGALRDVALEKLDRPLAIFFDEIDATRSLPFSVDEFFAGIRECYNRRVQDSAFGRLTFCLLGVAVPNDLINNPTSTPFNVGERIYLRDFTPEETMKLAAGLPGDGRTSLSRVYHWSNGHPYLTQSLCQAVALHGISTPEGVDDLVRRDLFDPKARETNINLSDVANRALHAGDQEPHPEQFRADLLSAYEQAWKGRPLADDESNRVASLLKLSGMMRSEGSKLFVRNRIYLRVFNRTWIREHMPGQEQRRQRRAFWLGVARTTAISGAVVSLIGGLYWKSARLAQRNAELAYQAQYDLYAALMQTLPYKISRNDLSGIRRTLAALRNSPHRGWEYDYWMQVAHPAGMTISIPDGGKLQWWTQITQDKGRALLAFRDQLRIYDLNSGKLDRAILIPRTPSGFWAATLMRDGNAFAWDGARVAIEVDLRSGTVIRTKSFDRRFQISMSDGTYPIGRFLPIGSDEKTAKPFVLDLASLSIRPLLNASSAPIQVSFSQDGTKAAWLESGADGRKWVSIRETADWREAKRFPDPPGGSRSYTWSPDGRLLIYDARQRDVVIRDVAGDKERLRIVMGAEPNLNAIAPDGKKLLVCTVGREALLLDLSAQLNEAPRSIPFQDVLERRIPEASWAAFLPGGRIFTHYWDIDVYDPAKEPPAEAVLPPGQYTSAVIQPSGRLTAWTAVPPRRYSMHLLAPRPIQTLTSAPLRGDSDDSGLIWAAYSNGQLEIHDVKTDRVLVRVPSIFDRLLVPVAASLDLRHIAVGAGQNDFYACDLPKVRPSPHKVTLPGAAMITSLRFSPNGEFLAVGDMAGGVYLWRTSDWRLAASAAVCRNPAGEFWFSLDGSDLAVQDDQQVCILKAATLERMSTLRDESSVVADLAFTPDLRRVATGSYGRTVRIWDSETGKELCIVGEHAARVCAVQFIDGGRTLASFSEDGVCKLWRTQ